MNFPSDPKTEDKEHVHDFKREGIYRERIKEPTQVGIYEVLFTLMVCECGESKRVYEKPI